MKRYELKRKVGNNETGPIFIVYTLETEIEDLAAILWEMPCQLCPNDWENFAWSIDEITLTKSDLGL